MKVVEICLFISMHLFLICLASFVDFARFCTQEWKQWWERQETHSLAFRRPFKASLQGVYWRYWGTIHNNYLHGEKYNITLGQLVFHIESHLPCSSLAIELCSRLSFDILETSKCGILSSLFFVFVNFVDPFFSFFVKLCHFGLI